MTVLFISDLHLSEQEPGNVRAFLSFLGSTGPHAEALYILGDLFEYWAGDDDETALSRTVGTALATLSAQGIRIGFIPGNRDFLLGPTFAASAGMEILPDPTKIRLGDRDVLLSHGDALCTDDAAYQNYRQMVRAPDWQMSFLQRPLAERRQLIEQLRQRSEQAKQEKSMEIMDVNSKAVESLLRSESYPALIHGHTHRPAVHIHDVDGRRCERWVLSDWHSEATYLEWSGEAFHPHVPTKTT
ncbi:MAG TPA: UDP-2,3-diacylglucosamine diphosphatase [Aromatoleum sp.]|uniref:UDP-2,3-diacylglucosamine diphosphatase n=1 Tax=Aromatoleum sp. TaxID=2307007 RepID=UPI002B4A7BF8|nr:UDP-2,3-diacylglucosamine diphosphatase [Aromatoleum sp.]HJV27619.1 UDP-2,3-diacylglucosamine diphosphatase [Aromatoleum sp.]